MLEMPSQESGFGAASGSSRPVPPVYPGGVIRTAGKSADLSPRQRTGSAEEFTADDTPQGSKPDGNVEVKIPVESETTIREKRVLEARARDVAIPAAREVVLRKMREAMNTAAAERTTRASEMDGGSDAAVASQSQRAPSSTENGGSGGGASSDSGSNASGGSGNEKKPTPTGTSSTSRQRAKLSFQSPYGACNFIVTWDGDDVHELLDAIQYARSTGDRFIQDKLIEYILNIPFRNPRPSDIPAFIGKPVWAVDRGGRALVGMPGSESVVELTLLREQLKETAERAKQRSIGPAPGDRFVQ